MTKYFFAFFIASFLFTISLIPSESHANSGSKTDEYINPNDFDGTDTERISQAVQKANSTSNLVRIPRVNANGSNIWMIDSAILLPSNLTLVLDNCTLQLSDSSRDNMFRSDNVGLGITDPEWNENISIYGIGKAILKGANNPRATGDGARMLPLNPKLEQEKGNWRVSYGTDAGKPDRKQKETGEISWC